MWYVLPQTVIMGERHGTRRTRLLGGATVRKCRRAVIVARRHSFCGHFPLRKNLPSIHHHHGAGWALTCILCFPDNAVWRFSRRARPRLSSVVFSGEMSPESIQPGCFYKNEIRQKGTQIQTQMHFRRRFPPAVFCPIQTVGDQLNRCRINHTWIIRLKRLGNAQ